MKVTCRPAVLGQALQVVSRAISSRTTLPILNNILIETTSEGLALTATNLEIGIRKLVPAEVSMEGSTTAPARLLTDFVSTLPDQDLEMTLDGATPSLNLRCARFDTHLKCTEAPPRLIDGTYPSYAQVIPSKSSTTVKVSPAELTQTVRAVSLFARDSANVIRVKAQAGSLVLSATTNEVGDSRAEMAADVDGSDIQIAFNARYVLDALGVIGEDQVQLLFDGPLSPGLLRPPGKDHYLYVTVPVRVAMS